MKTVAIIPARGGSKGIPRKNVYKLCGKPMVGWSIEAALQSRFIDKVIVSTDDDEISDVSQSFGAEIVHRPAELSGDFDSSESALLHVLAQQPLYDEIVFIQCCTPLTITEDIDGTIEKRRSANADTSFSATETHDFIWRIENDNLVEINHDKRKRLMRQQYAFGAMGFRENGSIYVMDVPGFIKHENRFFGKTVLYVMPVERMLDIDTIHHLRLAEMILKERDV